MAIQDSSTIMGSLLVRDKYEISPDRAVLAVMDNDDSLTISQPAINTLIQGNKMTVYGNKNIRLNSHEDIKIVADTEDITLHACKSIRLSCDRFRLPNSRAMYGTDDPNDLELHDVEEGTLYFKLVND